MRDHKSISAVALLRVTVLYFVLVGIVKFTPFVDCQSHSQRYSDYSDYGYNSYEDDTYDNIGIPSDSYHSSIRDVDEWYDCQRTSDPVTNARCAARSGLAAIRGRSQQDSWGKDDHDEYDEYSGYRIDRNRNRVTDDRSRRRSSYDDDPPPASDRSYSDRRHPKRASEQPRKPEFNKTASPEAIETYFKSWETRFKRVYSSHEERERRKQIWWSNMMKQRRRQRKKRRKFHLALNRYMDMTKDEFRERMCGFRYQSRVGQPGLQRDGRSTIRDTHESFLRKKRAELKRKEEQKERELATLATKWSGGPFEDDEDWKAIGNTLDDIFVPFSPNSKAIAPTEDDVSDRETTATRKPSTPSSRAGDPPLIDWRTRVPAVLSAVKDQKCNDCWAYSVVQTIESVQAIASMGLKPLSVQQLVTCGHAENLKGCEGGDIEAGFRFLTTRGLVPLASLPDEAHPAEVSKGVYKGPEPDHPICTTNVPPPPIKSYRFVTVPCINTMSNGDEPCLKQDERAMAAALQEGPLSIVMDSTCLFPDLSDEDEGIIVRDGCGCSSGAYHGDHALQLVGLRRDLKGDLQWVVRNTWTSDWADGGFIYVEFGKNVCGIANRVIQAILP